MVLLRFSMSQDSYKFPVGSDFTSMDGRQKRRRAAPPFHPLVQVQPFPSHTPQVFDTAGVSLSNIHCQAFRSNLAINNSFACFGWKKGLVVAWKYPLFHRSLSLSPRFLLLHRNGFLVRDPFSAVPLSSLRVRGLVSPLSPSRKSARTTAGISIGGDGAAAEVSRQKKLD